MCNISTKILYEALQYYSKLGYQMIDVPLVVDLDVSAHTKPDGVPELYHGKVGEGHRCYVASGEQSFIQLHKEGKLSDGKYMAVTPCYRHDRYVSDTHYLMFMKLELIVVGDISFANCDDIIDTVCDDARGFFLKQGYDVNRWDNNSEIDLTTSSGVELGSYGYRKMLDGTGYVYGTGCAFPRVSL